jgi:hypothetical protein
VVEAPKLRKEKSLEVLSIGFLKLFIYWRKTFTLEEAARKLVGDMEPQRLKTKVRRLYDIANVFKSLGLVKKTYLKSRKPGFEWIGVSGLRDMFQAKSESAQDSHRTLDNRSCSFFEEHIIKHFGGSKILSIESLMLSWNTNMWQRRQIPLTKSKNMCEVTSVKNSDVIF